jgi:ferredoxin-NADP reductase
LEFATRMRDTAFKRILKHAEPGTELAWDGPYGSFLLHKNAEKPAVFLAGGIGITPFMSMIKTAEHNKLGHEIYLFHSNHTPEDAPFQNELSKHAKKNSKFHFIPTMTDLKIPIIPKEEADLKSLHLSKEGAGSMTDRAGGWNGERGFVDQNMIERHVSDLYTPIYYMAGPAGFVSAMRKMLVEAKVDEDNIRFEEFPGY